MRIEWKGHACFLLTGRNGKRLLTDPFDEKVGYPFPSVGVDIATVSHQHWDHSAVQFLPAKPEVIQGTGEWVSNGFRIRGLSTWHDPEQGALRGPNTVFTIEGDGITVCHLGDLGHALEVGHLTAIGKVDVLCIPVGGLYTIDAQMAFQIVKQLGPAIVLPMHYKYDDKVQLPIAPVEDFLGLFSEFQQAEFLDLDRGFLPQKTGVILLTLNK